MRKPSKMVPREELNKARLETDRAEYVVRQLLSGYVHQEKNIHLDSYTETITLRLFGRSEPMRADGGVLVFCHTIGGQRMSAMVYSWEYYLSFIRTQRSCGNEVDRQICDACESLEQEAQATWKR